MIKFQKIKKIIIAAFILQSGVAMGSDHSVDAVEQQARQILANMNLQQKVGQMVQAEIKHVKPSDATKYGLGSILNGGGSFPNDDKHASVDDWLALADSFYEASLKTSDGSAGIPIIWGTDAVHGHNNVIGATIFPHNIGLGAANDVELMRKIGEATAAEVAVTGIDWIFAPTVAVVKDDRWGRTYEGYSDRPEIVVPFAKAMVDGMQGTGEAFLDDRHVIATAKHFIGDGGTFQGIDQGNTLANEAELIKEHGQGYVSAIGANVQTVMASFNSWQGEKLHGHKYLMTDVLRDQMGFEGFVVSDWNGHGQVKGCHNASCPQSVNAGVDMFMAPEDWKALIKNTIAQVENGEISEARIDEAVLRILKVKVAAGLFEKPKPSERSLAGKAELLGSEAHRDIAKDAVRKSLVLLKNNGQLLPLNRKQNVLVAGEGAANFEKQTGGWTVSWQGRGNTAEDFPGGSTIFDGIEAAVSASGGTIELSVDGSYQQKPDVAIVVFGEDPYAEGQGDIESLSYQAATKTDLALLKSLKAQGVPVVAVFLTGRPLWMNAEINASDAFVVAWLPGSEGAALADVLFKNTAGGVNHDFVGRLSFDWPNAELNAEDPDLPVADYLFEYGYGLSYASHKEVANDLNEKPLTEASGPDQLIFKGGPRAPYKLYIGDESNWQQEVAGGTGKTAFGELEVKSIDRVVQEDSRLAIWSGKGKRASQLYLQAAKSADFSELEQQGGALLMTLRVDEKPKGSVKLRMDCGWPCRGELDFANILKAVPEKQWFRIGVQLSCFAKAGVDMSKVNAPFLISTEKRLQLAIAEVAVVANPPQGSIIECGK